MGRRGSSIAALVALVVAPLGVAAQDQDQDEPAERTSISGDPFADDPPEGEPATPAPKPKPAPEPVRSRAEPAATPPAIVLTLTSTGPRVLVLVLPASERDRTEAMAVGDAAAALLAAPRRLAATTAREVLDPDQGLRQRRARTDALALAARSADALDALDLEVARDLSEEAALALAALPPGDRAVDTALQEALLGMAVAALYDSDVLRADDAFVALGSLLAVSGKDTALFADPRRYPSKVLQRFELTRADLEARATGRIEVRSTPEGVTVRVDGVERGRTPVEVGGLAEGLHVVTLEAAGRKSSAALVDVVASDVVPVERTLGADPLIEALARVPSPRDLQAAVEWARGLGLGRLFLGDTSAMGTVRGAWIDVGAGQMRGSVEVVLGGGVEASGRALAGAIDAAERAHLAPPVLVDEDGGGPSLASRWWFWAGVGGALVLAAAGAAVAVAAQDGAPPRGTAIFGF